MSSPTELTSLTGLTELDRESRMGGEGAETLSRPVRRIDLSDFDARRALITEELWDAAVEVGFFQIHNHGIDPADVDAAFAAAQRFFALPERTKGQYALKKGLNSGWESGSQIRPSTGTPDQKESYQVTRPHMDGLWPSEAELAGFRETVLRFERQCWEVAMRVLSCFADKLGFERDFFAVCHDPRADTYQSTLRLLHYFAVTEGAQGDPVRWRAGAHTDFDCLTLLFQREGQGGLQVCPGKERDGEQWTPIAATADSITCNIGDMLMRWSDDRLPSNFHRVRSPRPDEDQGPRHSIAFFAQANRDAVIEGPRAAYLPITAGEYLRQRINANFAR